MTVSMSGERGIGSVQGPGAWSGLLLIDKPTRMTSHDVVDRVRRRLKVKSAGHLGTLDPAASGLLVLALGAATRCAQVWQGGEKLYEAGMRFGVVTSSQDLSGEVLETHPVELDEAEVRDQALELVGETEQVPPMVSALKIGGQRLYRLARRGIEVERAPRKIRVASWEWLAFELPLARFRVRCSSGTYVRTLAHDLGRRLGCGAALESLRRLRSEPFGIEQALPLRELDHLSPDEVRAAAGLPLGEALRVLPTIELDDRGAAEIGFGRAVELRAAEIGTAPLLAGPRSIAIFDRAGLALALGELEPDPADHGRVRLSPHAVFPWAVREGTP